MYNAKIELSHTVVTEARYLKFQEPVLDNLRVMLKKGVRCTHPLGNFRYNDYLFQITNGVVCGVNFLSARESRSFNYPNCQTCHDTKIVLVYESCVCVDRGEEGCPFCKGKREIQVNVSCQTCNPWGRVKNNKYKKGER